MERGRERVGGGRGQGVRLPMEARRRRMETVNTETAEQCGKTVVSKGEEGKKTGGSCEEAPCDCGERRSGVCQDSGILKEKERKCNVTARKTRGCRLVSEKKMVKKSKELLKIWMKLQYNWDDVLVLDIISKHVVSSQKKKKNCPFVFFAGPTYTWSPTGATFVKLH